MKGKKKKMCLGSSGCSEEVTSLYEKKEKKEKKKKKKKKEKEKKKKKKKSNLWRGLTARKFIPSKIKKRSNHKYMMVTSGAA